MPDIDFQKIVLNLIPKREDDPVVFYASQYETTRRFIADLMWGDTEFAPGDDYWAEIDIRKNDDNLVVITEDVAIDNNEVSVILPVQAVTCIGKNLGQIKIYAGEDQFVAAFNFILEVQADPLAGGVTSETAIDNLESQIEDIAEEVIGEDYYDKTEVDALLADKADKSELPDMNDYYNKVQTDALLADKADLSDLPDLSNYYTKSETNGLISTLANQVNNKFDDIMPIGSATGNPCTFDTEYPYLIQGLKADIVCSGGGGTPSTPIPLVPHTELNLTRCGVNLFDDAYIDNNLTAEQILPAGTYYIKAFVTGSSEQNRRFSIYFNDTWNVIDNEGTFDDGGITWSGSTFGWLYANATATVTLTKPYKLRASVLVDTYQTRRYAIYDDNSITQFIEYNGQTFTVAFGQTVYGGVYDKSGRLTITWAGVDMGTLNYTYDSSIPRFWTNEITDIKHPSSQSIAISGLADIYKVVSFDDLYYRDKENGTLACSMSGVVSIINTAYTDAPTFKTAMSGVMLAYELATPIVIDVRSINFVTEDGTNNITSDCIGDVTAYYKDSIQHYIDTRL